MGVQWLTVCIGKPRKLHSDERGVSSRDVASGWRGLSLNCCNQDHTLDSNRLSSLAWETDELVGVPLTVDLLAPCGQSATVTRSFRQSKSSNNGRVPSRVEGTLNVKERGSREVFDRETISNKRRKWMGSSFSRFTCQKTMLLLTEPVAVESACQLRRPRIIFSRILARLLPNQ
jgi:hypothetical protein